MAIKKLTSEDVHNICISLAQGEKGSVLAKRYNVSHVTISDIRYGRRHGEISKLYNLKPYKISDEIAHEICKLMAEGKSNAEIRQITGQPASIISNIRRKKTHRNVSDLYDYKTNLYKIDKEEVIRICELLQEGKRVIDISKITGVSPETISAINRGKSYTYISKDYNLRGYRKSKRKLDEDTVHKVCKYLEDGYRNNEVAKMCEVSTAMVSSIRVGNTYYDISKNYNIERYFRGNRLDNRLIHEVCKLLEEGKTVVEISRKLDISRNNVYRIMRVPLFEKIRTQYNLNNNVKERERNDTSN